MEIPATDESGTFKPTRWSLILKASQANEPSAAPALNELCRTYWFPLYCFARRRGLPPPDAEDATQSFFARILEQGMLTRADPEKGRLRTYILTAFQRHLADLSEHRMAQKRGGNLFHVSIDDAEARYSVEPMDTLTPEIVFQQRWALTVLENSLDILSLEWRANGREAVFEGLRQFLSFSQSESPETYRTAGAAIGLTPGAARVAVHRLRKRFREILLSLVADTLADPSPDALREETQAMLAAISR